MAGESASLFLSVFWKMSSALKDCQQVFEAGTLESDRKRAFGLFFSPRNPAPVANPWQLRFYFFTRLWGRRNRTRPGRGLLMPAPGTGSRTAAWAGGEGSSQWPPCLLCCSRLLTGSGPSSPRSPSRAGLQSPWDLHRLQHTWPFHLTPGGRISPQQGSSAGTEGKITGLTDLVTYGNRVIRHFIWGRHTQVSELWVDVQRFGHPWGWVEASLKPGLQCAMHS